MLCPIGGVIPALLIPMVRGERPITLAIVGVIPLVPGKELATLARAISIVGGVATCRPIKIDAGDVGLPCGAIRIDVFTLLGEHEIIG